MLKLLFCQLRITFLPLDEAKLQDAVLSSYTGRAGGRKQQDGSGVPEYSPAMQLKDVPFKVIQGHLSRSQSKARI
jgi:hypothetical protein